MADARRILIADIGNFLRLQLREETEKQFAGDKEESDLTPFAKHQIGILAAVCDQAEKVFNRHAIRLMPPKGALLEDNIIYVNWDGRKLSYIHRNRKGEAPDYTECSGEIVRDELPKLREVNVPLESYTDLKSLFIEILKILVKRGHVELRETGKEYGRSTDGVLRQLLDSREWFANDWVGRITKIQKNYFKKIFIEEYAHGDEGKVDKAAMHKYVQKQLSEIEPFTSLYRNIFRLYSYLLRQQFCLEQFVVFAEPERFIQEKSESALKKITFINGSLNSLKIKKLKEEIACLNSAFATFKAKLEDEKPKDILPFDSVPRQYQNIRSLIKVFKKELAALENARANLEIHRAKAKSAANSGDEAALQNSINVAKKAIRAIEGAKKKLNSAIADCIREMHGRVGDINESHQEVLKEIQAQMPNVSTLKLLVEIAVAMENDRQLDDKGKSKLPANEFERLRELSKNLSDACEEHKSLFKENGWPALAKNFKNGIAKLERDIKAYAQPYLAHRDKVNHIANEFKAVHDMSQEVSLACRAMARYDDTFESIPDTLADISQKWSVMYGNIKTEEYDDILKLSLNGFKAFMRNHWWKMLAVGLVFGIIAAPIALFVLKASLIVTAVMTVGALIAGVVTGIGVGKLIDKCRKPSWDALEGDELYDEEEDQEPLEDVIVSLASSRSSSPNSSVDVSPSLSRSSSTEILGELEGIPPGDPILLLAVATEKARKDLEELKESSDSSELSSQPQPSSQSAPHSTNPFDEGYRRSSFNPF